MSIFARIGRFVRTYSTGVVAAGLSVCFATYMALTGGARDGALTELAAVRHAPVRSPLKKRLEISIVPERRILPDAVGEEGADPIMTGSLPPSAGKGDRLRTYHRPGRGRSPRYVLRFATPVVALVEGEGRLWNVEPGDILPGMGRVIRIERRGKDRWVLKASDGKITREISTPRLTSPRAGAPSGPRRESRRRPRLPSRRGSGAGRRKSPGPT